MKEWVLWCIIHSGTFESILQYSFIEYARKFKENFHATLPVFFPEYFPKLSGGLSILCKSSNRYTYFRNKSIIET